MFREGNWHRVLIFLVGLCLLVAGYTLAAAQEFTLERVVDSFEDETPFFGYPAYVAVNPLSGEILVSDWEKDRLLVFDSAWKLIKVVNGLEGPVGIAFSGDGSRIYVVEQKANQIRVLDGRNYEVKLTIKPEGLSLKGPRGIWASGGRLYLTDTDNSRIVVLDETGKLLFTFGKEGMGKDEFYYPRGIAVDAQGRIWVADTVHHLVKVFAPDGSFLFEFGGEGSERERFNRSRYLFIKGEWVFITDYNNHRVKVYDLKGTLHYILGQGGDTAFSFSHPEGLWVDDEGHLLVADAGRMRIVVIGVFSLIKPEVHLVELLEEGKIKEFFQYIERLPLEEREKPETLQALFEAYQMVGDLEGMIAQAEQLFLKDPDNRPAWKDKLGELYFQKAASLREAGRAREALSFYKKSYQYGYRSALFPYLWLSFALLGGANSLLIILALVFILLLLIFIRLRIRRYREW
ncbi:MAG: hypothetical protein PWP60_283 [Candidatus Atribacteria bacterium]|uniref:6-bladed beta-propeller n=1 Tax=Atrimonas thermophila TaxID=3064161 RepID=UPI0024AA199A|nr:hypothetical protein [Candidatus Atribacteria bacterium]MDI3530434.1 hypothetical protein [Candidatus Atribacteria bacterium]